MAVEGQVMGGEVFEEGGGVEGEEEEYQGSGVCGARVTC